MKKYARFLSDGRVAEIHLGDPTTDFVASIAAEFEEIPDDVYVNDKRLDDGTFEPYVAEVGPEVSRPKFLAEAQLKTFMTRDERISYKAAATDEVVADFQEMLALGPVDLEDAETISAIDKLEELSVLTAARATELKALED
jgi:hypothetical protein